MQLEVLNLQREKRSKMFRETLPRRAAGCSGIFSLAEFFTGCCGHFEEIIMPQGDGKTPQQRFSNRYSVDPVTGCWNWIAGRTSRGYASIWVPEGKTGGKKGKCVLAHIASYTWKNGPVPKGLELDHTCRNPRCVNPDHLEPVTHKVNCLRGESPMALNARKTTCPRGHQYSGAYKRTNGLNRYCQICENIRNRKRKQNTRKAG